jgi:copper chaperone NosL
MPWIVGALVLSGLGAAAAGRQKALYGWLIAFALLAAAGLADFYRWSYDYGHNLDAETAIIVVPGMTYQPPLIGEKQLLNFRAASWPALGGLLAGLAFGLGAAAAVLTFRAGRRARAAVVAVSLAAAACTGAEGPHQIAYDGSESCAFCRMAITDRQYGAELVTANGKVHQFDSIECLASFVAQARPTGVAASIWVSDFEKPGTLIAADQARFVRSRGSRNSPMGLGLMAFGSEISDADLLKRFGIVLRWTEVVTLVESERLRREADIAALVTHAQLELLDVSAR